jgi:HEAT repeat protein
MKSLVLSLLMLTPFVSGCRLAEKMPGNWYVAKDRTTYRTPDMRLDAIREIANRADGSDSPQQQKFVSQLASQIQIEPDPLIRRQIIRTVSEFRVPQAEQVLLAGLGDSEAMVRRASCEQLGERGQVDAIDPLAQVVANDSSTEVRIAATRALGGIKSPAAARACTAALSDSDPAMQFAGVQAMKSITGQDHGPNVATWLQVAQGEQPAPAEPETSVATRPRGWLPF